MTNSASLIVAELSQFRTTGRHDEVEKLCTRFMSRWPDAARSFEFGCSPEGRTSMALAASRTRMLNPKEIYWHEVSVPTIQVVIHSGESNGKNSGFIVLCDMLERTLGSRCIEQNRVVICPSVQRRRSPQACGKTGRGLSSNIN